jgi:hypothetical protein
MIWKSALPACTSADQLLERLPTVDAQPALALVGVGADDLDVAPGGVLADFVALVLRRVLLVLGGHAHVLRGADTGRSLLGLEVIRSIA